MVSNCARKGYQARLVVDILLLQTSNKSWTSDRSEGTASDRMEESDATAEAEEDRRDTQPSDLTRSSI